MMYQIEYLGEFIYGPDVKHCILDPSLEEELNSAGKLTFTIPVENEFAWKNIEVFKGEVRVYEGDDVIWFGRPFQIVRDWLNRKVVTCEGALSYFNDSLQATHEYDKLPLYTDPEVQSGKTGFINTIIGIHNDQVKITAAEGGEDHSREIKIGIIDVENESNIYRQVDYQTTAEVLQQMCLDTNGGYFILRKEREGEDLVSYLDWRKQVPYGTNQDIRFGLNLLDLNQDLNGSDICTAVLAFGKDDKTVSGLNKWNDPDHPYILASGSSVWHNGEYIYHKQGYKRFGRVLKVKSWSDMSAVGQDNKENLFIKAAQWLEDQNTDIVTIECNAADLHYLSEYADKGKLRIGQLVRVSSPPHDLDLDEEGEPLMLPIFKISMRLDSGAKTITIGTPPKRELTDIVKSNGGSTRGSSGTTGGGGGSSGSGGGGSSSVSVKDVRVKYPGDTDYRTVVKKKVAEIDLSDLAGDYVEDVTLDGNTIVENGTAKLKTQDIVAANPTGESAGDLASIKIGGTKYDIPVVTDIVTDVTLDGTSIVDPNDNVAKILSRDIIEEGVEGNFEHVVEKDDDPPTINLGKDTDLFIETDILDDEDIILSTSDTPINLQEIGGWYSYVQDFVAQPTAYIKGIDPQTLEPIWDWDPSTPERVYHTISCNGIKETTWWFPDVPSAYPYPYSHHNGTLHVYGYKINTSGYVDIIFEKHDQNVRYRPTKVRGTFNFKIMHAGAEGSYMPVQEEYCCSDIIRIHVSNDGENWTTYEPVSAPQDGNGTFIFDIDGYYSYIRMSCTNNVYNPAGYQHFTVHAVPESVIDDIWYKTANKTWIKMPHVKDVQIDGVSIVSDKVANIDSSQFGTPVEANPQTGTSVGNLTSILIGENKYDIPSGGGGSSVVPNPSGSPSSRLIKIGIDGVIYEVSAGTGGAESVEFDYTGDIQTFVAPKTSAYKLEVWGAQGGSGGAGVHGGYGGYSVGMINLNQGDTLYVCVGGKGGGSDTSDTGVVGYNGGGEANYGGSRGNGGGATHIALITGTLNTLSIVPSNVIIVAGAGGGSGYINTTLLTDACMYGYGVSESADPATKTVSVNLYSSDPEEIKAKVGNGYARISWSEDFDPYVTVGDLYNACVANNVTPASHSLNDIVAEFLRVN